MYQNNWKMIPVQVCASKLIRTRSCSQSDGNSMLVKCNLNV